MTGNKINIIFVNYSLDVGGIETLILELSRKLNPDRFHLEICAFSEGGNLQNEFEASGIPVHIIRKKAGIDLGAPLKLARLFKERRIDIAHTQNRSSWLYAVIAARITRVFLVHTVHSNVDFKNPHPRRWMILQRYLAKFTDQIIAVSNSNAGFLTEKQNIPDRKIRVIYNGIIPELYDRPCDTKLKKQELSIGEGDLIIGNVARFSPPKDHETLIRAFKSISQTIPSARLLLVGDGPLENTIRGLVNALDLNAKVKFLGSRRDIPELLKIFDVFTLSSFREGFSVAILEAMAAGLPVVATNVAGNPEAVINEETGLIVPPKNPEALARAICRLLLNGEEARRMGEKGRKRVKEHFSLEKMVKEYEDVYDSLMSKGGA
jgi:sugar transferase (PEP-CTERM/EpsH1 system associated)